MYTPNDLHNHHRIQRIYTHIDTTVSVYRIYYLYTKAKEVSSVDVKGQFPELSQYSYHVICTDLYDFTCRMRGFALNTTPSKLEDRFSTRKDRSNKEKPKMCKD